MAYNYPDRPAGVGGWQQWVNEPEQQAVKLNNILGVNAFDAANQFVAAQTGNAIRNLALNGGYTYDDDGKLAKQRRARELDEDIVADPAAWLRQANDDANRVDREATAIYNTIHASNIALNMAPEEAHRNAQKAADDHHEVLMKQHRLRFPDSEREKVIAASLRRR